MADSDLTAKTCQTCKTAKPRSEFHRNKSAKDGLCARCKPCNCAHVNKARLADPERTKQRKQADYEKHKEKRLQRCKDYRQENLEACLARSRARDKQKILAQNRSYYARNREQMIAMSAKWAAANREKRNEISRAWGKANPATRNALGAKRNASELQATPAWADPKAILKFYKTAKEMCVAHGIEYHVDHIVPLQGKTVCGLHVEHNLQVITKADNIRKSNRHWPDMP